MLSASTKLAITLQMLAGSTYLDVQWPFQVFSATVYNMFRDTVEKVIQQLEMETCTMKDKTTLERRALEFKTSRKMESPFDGFVGALDAISIAFEMPTGVPNQAFVLCLAFLSNEETLTELVRSCVAILSLPLYSVGLLTNVHMRWSRAPMTYSD